MNDRPILIVDDEKELSVILGEYLELEGFKTLIAFDGEDGLKKFNEGNPKLVVLDIMLPKINGIEVCKEIRHQSDVPIIMLSAKSGELDKVVSLGAGADDYVTKPFGALELVARVKAHCRRYDEHHHVSNDEELKVGKLFLNKGSYEASVDGEKLELTTKEFEVLLFFAGNLNRVFSKEQIYTQVWGDNEFGDISTVAVYIKRLRVKLDKYEVDYIKTIWGAGYKMAVD